jgi:hypothetical protein
VAELRWEEHMRAQTRTRQFVVGGAVAVAIAWQAIGGIAQAAENVVDGARLSPRLLASADERIHRLLGAGYELFCTLRASVPPHGIVLCDVPAQPGPGFDLEKAELVLRLRQLLFPRMLFYGPGLLDAASDHKGSVFLLRVGTATMPVPGSGWRLQARTSGFELWHRAP